jgi:HSP20 family protein
MTLLRWAPRGEIESFTRDPFVRRFFEAFTDGASFDSGGGAWYPALDLVEEKDRLVVEVELPGVEAKDVQIHLQGEVLTVQGERKAELEESQGKYLKREHSWGRFQRTLQLPYRVQADKVKAQYKNGVMVITLPKAEEHVGRQIPVEMQK